MTVYLVGAGPGDPGLITVRGAELLGRADVVVYDRLVSASLLGRAAEGAELIDVGKVPGEEVDQDGLNRLLVDRGRGGACVVRLKGGDPFVFGRGGEEAAALAAAGVPFEVVPGVSAALAVPAYAGIPVTHRGLAGVVTVITGHSRRDGGPELEPDWEALARVGGTIVVLMGVAQRARIKERLMAGGLDGATPTAAIRWGTRPDQATVRTTLARLPDADVAPPATIVIGPVAGLDLTWYESRPLFGRKVVVTRRDDDLTAHLRDAGADVAEVPAIGIENPVDGGAALASAAGRIGTYAWVVLTSANGVERLFSALRDARALGATRVAAVGSATAAALRAHGVEPDLVGESTGAALGASFPEAGGPEAPAAPSATVLLPRAERADPALPAALRRKGWAVEEVAAYRSVPEPGLAERVDEVVGADAVIFASGSAVESVGARVGRERLPAVVCIGPTTAEAARRCGLEVAAVAAAPTPAALVDAVVAALRAGS